MTTEIKQNWTITFTLSEEEARTLKGLVQNDLQYGGVNEPVNIRNLREDLFNKIQLPVEG